MAKLLLLVLANYADQEGECFPGLDTLAERCEVTRPTLIKMTNLLLSEGLLISAKKRPGGDGGGAKSKKYKLAWNESKQGLPSPVDNSRAKVNVTRAKVNVTRAKVNDVYPNKSVNKSDNKSVFGDCPVDNSGKTEEKGNGKSREGMEMVKQGITHTGILRNLGKP